MIGLGFWLACVAVAATIGHNKGILLTGFWLGALLGPIGVLIVSLMRGRRKPCPYCKESIFIDALICPHCTSDLVAERSRATQAFISPSGKEIGPRRTGNEP